MSDTKIYETITDGGVKNVYVREAQDPSFVVIKIVDDEGLGKTLYTTTIRKDDIRSVPHLVEDFLLDNFLMGPTWFWNTRRFGEWEGQFALLTNHKVSDHFRNNHNTH